MSPTQRRAAELAQAIADALQADPPGTGTKIDIEDGDWEIICLGLGLVVCCGDEELKAKH